MVPPAVRSGVPNSRGSDGRIKVCRQGGRLDDSCEIREYSSRKVGGAGKNPIIKKVFRLDGIELSMKTLHVPVIIETDEDGVFIISCPQFKGCHTYGRTIDEALDRIREAIGLCLEDSRPEDLNTFIGFREVEIIQGT